jgi:MFS family permease
VASSENATDARPRRILPAIVASQFAGTSLWFAGNALVGDLDPSMVPGPDAVASITSAVQAGFIAGTLLFAFANLADRLSPRRLFFACCLLAAASNAAILALPHVAQPFRALLVLRFATGLFLAGIYPVGMRIASGWYREGLGHALGWLTGALVLGTAFPHLLKGAFHGIDWQTAVVGLSSLAALGGAVMYAMVPDGPWLARAGRFDPKALLAVFSSRELRASAFGYFGHMWELYTLWAMVPLVLAAYAARAGAPAIDASFWSFCVIGAGAAGCIGGGWISQRVGSAKVAFAQLSASGLCCLLSPFAYMLPWPAFAAFLLAWGVVVVGDSPQLSALTAATAPRALVGSALTIVNCIGFALTVVSLEVATRLANVLPFQALLAPLAVGPALGLLALRRLLRRAP